MPDEPKQLRVLFLLRPDSETWPGGDTVQAEHTAAALAAEHVDVHVAFEMPPDLAGFDCVHLWHLERTHETAAHLPRLLAEDLPLVLSPIHWPPQGRPRRAGGYPRLVWWREEAKNAVRLLLAEDDAERRAAWFAVRHGWWTCRQALLEAADVLLPNSRAEAACLAQETETPGVVVPNGVTAEALALDEAPADSVPAPLADLRILCAGHFDPRKNQLGLIRALAGTDLSVTFLGGPRRMHGRYHARCLRQGQPVHRFAGSLPHDEVLAAMRHARVHVCPSLLETPGLANLEAGLLGCVLVVPDCPPVREAFGEHAIYFQPGAAADLRRAVETAVATEPNPALPARIRATYTWQEAAARTRDAYALAMRTHGQRTSADLPRQGAARA